MRSRDAMHALLDEVLLDLKRPPAPSIDPRASRAIEVLVSIVRDLLNKQGGIERVFARLGDRDAAIPDLYARGPITGAPAARAHARLR